MREGSIMDVGTHAELLARGVDFSTLVKVREEEEFNEEEEAMDMEEDEDQQVVDEAGVQLPNSPFSSVGFGGVEESLSASGASLGDIYRSSLRAPSKRAELPSSAIAAAIENGVGDHQVHLKATECNTVKSPGRGMPSEHAPASASSRSLLVPGRRPFLPALEENSVGGDSLERTEFTPFSRCGGYLCDQEERLVVCATFSLPPPMKCCRQEAAGFLGLSEEEAVSGGPESTSSGLQTDAAPPVGRLIPFENA